MTLVCVYLLSFGLMAGVMAAPLHIVTGNYPPFCFEEDGVQKGIAVDLVREAFLRMHEKVQIDFFPFSRSVAMFKGHEADAIFPFSRDSEREEYTLFPTEKLVEDIQTLFVRSDSSITFSGNLSDMAAYSFGRQRDARNGALFAEVVRSGVITKIDEALDQRQNVQKLIGGRVQVVIGPRLVVLYEAGAMGHLNDIRELHPAVDKALAAYLGFSKQVSEKDIVRRYDRAMQAMRRDGTYEKITKHYVN